MVFSSNMTTTDCHDLQENPRSKCSEGCIGPVPFLRVGTSPASSSTSRRIQIGGGEPPGRSIKHTPGAGRLELQPEGRKLLQDLAVLPANTSLVFALGGSRVGKSTVGNRLLRLQDVEVVSSPEQGAAGVVSTPEDRRAPAYKDDARPDAGANDPRAGANNGFYVGHGFRHVTQGVDLAARFFPQEQKMLLYFDCEGSYHPAGSTAGNATNLGLVGLVAYCVADWIMSVTMGSFDERDIESLALLTNLAKAHVWQPPARGATSRSNQEELRPGLLLLVNSPRFHELEAEPEKVLGSILRGANNAFSDVAGSHSTAKGQDDLVLNTPRRHARESLSQEFADVRIMGLPNNQAKKETSSANHVEPDKLSELRRWLLFVDESESSTSKSSTRSGGRHWSSGFEILRYIELVVEALNAGWSKSASPSSTLDGVSTPSPARLFRPASAVDTVARELHLEPLADKLSEEFVAGARSAKTRTANSALPLGGVLLARLTQRAMADYDAAATSIKASSAAKATVRSNLSRTLKRLAGSFDDAGAVLAKPPTKDTSAGESTASPRYCDLDNLLTSRSSCPKGAAVASGYGASKTSVMTTSAGDHETASKETRFSKETTTSGALSIDPIFEANSPTTPTSHISHAYYSSTTTIGGPALLGGGHAGLEDESRGEQRGVDMISSSTTAVGRAPTTITDHQPQVHDSHQPLPPTPEAKRLKKYALELEARVEAHAEEERVEIDRLVAKLHSTVEASSTLCGTSTHLHGQEDDPSPKFLTNENDSAVTKSAAAGAAPNSVLSSAAFGWKKIPPSLISIADQVDGLGRRMSQTISRMNRDDKHDFLQRRATEMLAASAETIHESHSSAELQRIHSEALAVRKDFGYLETQLTAAGEKLMQSADAMDSRLGDVESVLRDATHARKEMASRLERTLQSHAEGLREMLDAERQDRLERAEMTQRMVAAVSHWLSTTE
ncbi:unnamed protein product [Amoebophrya sp. A25]|nr:unnamed protein product [Amoebophrya sp. A25]|eukprot:GSA25T00022507001.1